MNCQGESKIRSSELDLDKGEDGGEADIVKLADAEARPLEDSDFQSPPTTPKSTTSSPFLECPSTPILKYVLDFELSGITTVLRFYFEIVSAKMISHFLCRMIWSFRSCSKFTTAIHCWCCTL